MLDFGWQNLNFEVFWRTEITSFKVRITIYNFFFDRFIASHKFMQTLSIPYDNLRLNQSELIWGFGKSRDKRGWERGWFSRKIGRFFKMIISPCLVLFRWRWCLLNFTDEGSNAGKIGRACKVFSLASQCGTYRNLPSYFFDKNFVKATFL